MILLINSILKGIGVGLLLSVSVGPIFFALLQNSIDKGFRAGVLMALGISLSDSLYILFTYIGIIQFLQNDMFKTWLGICGGFIIAIFGIATFVKPVKVSKNSADDPQRKGAFRYILKGFVLNGINPMVFIFWIGIVSMTTTIDTMNNEYMVYLFFASIVLTVFLTDTLKAYLAHKLRNLITTKFQVTINRMVGSGLMIFGVRLIFLTIGEKML